MKIEGDLIIHEWMKIRGKYVFLKSFAISFYQNIIRLKQNTNVQHRIDYSMHGQNISLLSIIENGGTRNSARFYGTTRYITFS